MEPEVAPISPAGSSHNRPSSAQPVPLPFSPVHHATAALRKPGRAPRCVDYADAAKPCTLNEPFVLPRRRVDRSCPVGNRSESMIPCGGRKLTRWAEAPRILSRYFRSMVTRRSTGFFDDTDIQPASPRA